ncbi:MAG: MFS transporter [Alphaproteobacteria bacterium]|nr:MFS transporter [Alphaproteobacteria bacterium]
MSQTEARTGAGTVTEAPFRARFGWAMFDWANQPYFTVITTFIFAPYFAATVVGDPVRGQSLWGDTQAIAGLLIALCSPFLGSIADAGGPRKPWILSFQALCFAGCVALWWAVPGADATRIGWIMLALVMAAVGAEFSIVFNNAMLPDLVPPDRMGRLSGSAWALGYFGGLVALIVVLLAFSLPEQPWFGLDRASRENDRVVGPLAAGWLALFLIPLLVFTPDQRPSGLSRIEAVRQGIASVVDTVRKLRHYRNIIRFLIARMIAYDGLTAIFSFGGIYAVGIFGWDTTALGVFGIILTVFAGFGAWAGGHIDDRVGSKWTMQASLLGVLLATLAILSMSRESVFFILQIDGPAGGGLFASTAERIFILLGILLGVFGGPLQAASRTMMARLAPPGMVGEFYGMYSLSGKATAFLAPFVVARATDGFDSQRAGLAAIAVFLVVGFLLMIPVREEQAEKV